MERYLPPAININYRRLLTYKDRCQCLEEIESYVKSQKMRGSISRSAVQIGEELLMNAMYQAPLDEKGERLFADVKAHVRIRRKTPEPVSLRFTAHNGSLYLCVRDRFGSFKREDLAHYLFQCVTQNTPIEKKKLGAGLGLYLVVSKTTKLIVNIQPGGLSEFIAILEPPKSGNSNLQLLSLTTQRPVIAKTSRENNDTSHKVKEGPSSRSPMEQPR
jgi:hypothetical protein